MESKIKQRELNISFRVISINLERIEKLLKQKNELLKQTNDQKIKNKIKDLLIIKNNGKNHAELWINISGFYMKKPELFKKYSSNYLIKKFKFDKKDTLNQQLLESVEEIINSCNWYDSDVRTIYISLYADYYLLRLLSNSIDFKKYIKSETDPPLFSENIDSSLKKYCKGFNIDLKISGLHGQMFGPENCYDNSFIFDFPKEKTLISQINNFQQYLDKINPNISKNFDFFDIGIKFHFLYDWLNSKWTNIKYLLEFYKQVIKLINEQEIGPNDKYIIAKFNSKKHTYISHIYSIIYEFLSLTKNNSLPKILNTTIKLIEENSVINCNINNPFLFKEVESKEGNNKSKKIFKFDNNFINKFIDYICKFQIRNNTFHLNNKRNDSPWYKDVLIDEIDNHSWHTVDDIKQTITYLKNLICKPFAFLWNFMRKITNDELMCSFEELLKVYF